MLATDSALMRTQEPALEERRDPVDARQDRLGRLSTTKEHSPVVAIAELGQAAIALEPVGDHHRARLHRVLHERKQAVC